MKSGYQAIWPTGTAVRFRLLSFAEHRRALSLQVSEGERDLWVYRLAVLDGPPPEQVTAGIMCWVSKFLLEDSPFGGKQEVVDKFRGLARQEFAGDFFAQGRALIAGTFRYQFEEIEDWDQERFFRALTAAEFLTGRGQQPAEEPTAPRSQDDMIAEAVRKKQEEKAAVRAFHKKRIAERRSPR